MPLDQAHAIQTARRADLAAELGALWPGWPQGITLEIGCGHGHFLTAYAQAHPQEYCLGLDLLEDRIRRARRKAHRAGLKNLSFVQADARLLLDTLPDGVHFNRAFVLFPDPWPKRRHHKHRLMQTAFLDVLAQRAGRGARLYFRTDYEPYFRDALADLRASSTWALADEPWPFEFETVFQSRADSHHSCIARRSPHRA